MKILELWLAQNDAYHVGRQTARMLVRLHKYA